MKYSSKHRALKVLLTCCIMASVLGIYGPNPNASTTVLMGKAQQKKAGQAKEAVQPPDKHDRETVNAFVAQLDDEQARRLLISELEKTPVKPAGASEAQPSGFVRMIQGAHEFVALLHTRLTALRSGLRAAPDYLPRAYADLQRVGELSPLRLISSLLTLFLAALGAEWFFRRYTRDMRTRLSTTPEASWTIKVKRLIMLRSIDLASIGVFVITTLLLFFIFLDDGEFRRLLVLTYLAVVLIVRGLWLVSMFILAPHEPALRWVPLDNASASALHTWLVRISMVAATGLLISGFMELERASEALVIATEAITGLLVTLILITLILANRRSVSQLILGTVRDCSIGGLALRSQMADLWHVFAIPHIVTLWMIWVLYLLLGRGDMLVPLLALWVSVPLFLVVNGGMQRLLDATFGIVDGRVNVIALGEPQDGEGEDAVPAPTVKDTCDKSLNLSRVLPIIRRCLSICLGAALFFWILRFWGFNVRLGQTVTRAAFQISLAIILCFAAWKVIDRSITRRLATLKHSESLSDDEGMGGSGGSRLGTLLLLLRKFLLVVLFTIFGFIALSAMGVDIKPLLAGAGVVGLAIGFGSQTLVKDIVSGIFYLVDDAFRIGDYVEAGKVTGTVEHISIRSIRLRHSRGMIHTIPFSQMGSVTNYSRDYLIDKIDIRVPFGTDMDKVRKIIKRIGKEVEEDEELGPSLLAPIKSQGIKAFDDSAIITRVKIKTRPGKQFIIRRHVFSRIQKAFEESGIEFAHRHVIVRVDNEPLSETPAAPGEGKEGSSSSPKAKLLSAGAAAAIAQALAEEEAKREEKNE